jgi:Mrp family chromosome partitioning ATPase
MTIPMEPRDAVRRALRAAIDRGAGMLGVIENMVGGTFSGAAGDELAAEFGIPVLARIPWHPTAAVWGEVAASVRMGEAS